MALVLGLAAVALAALGVAGWMLLPRADDAPAPEPVAAPRAPERRGVDADPTERVTLPPTVGLFEEEDLEDAETVLASSDDMARMFAEIDED